MIIIIYGITIFLCILGITIKPKNRIFQYIVLILISFLIGRGPLTLDTDDYYFIYHQSSFISFSDTYEPGYLLLEKIGIYLDLDYIQFRFSTVFMTLFIISVVARKILGKNIYFFYLFYLFFLVFMDTVQLRNLIGFSIVLYGLSRLIYAKGTKSVISYTFYILIASTIHISSLAYIVFLLATLKNKKNLTYIVVLVSIVGCLGIFFGGVNSSIIRNSLNAISGGAERLGGYGTVGVNFGFIYAFTLHLMSLLFLHITAINGRKEYAKCIINGYENSELRSKNLIINFIILINLISIIYFPLYMFDLQFIRLSRNILLVNIIAFSMFFFKYRYKKLSNVVLYIMIIILTSSWFYFNFIIGDHIEDIIVPFFQEENILS